MTPLLDYLDSPLWRYYNNAFVSNHKTEEKDNAIEIEIKIPGVKKEDITIKYKSENRAIEVSIEGDSSRVAYLERQIDPEGITASLDLGVLKITAPIKNTDKIIQIT